MKQSGTKYRSEADIIMDAAERRNAIYQKIKSADGPVSATALAGMLGVSRQIIVGDVALLRASGHDILSTPRGYVLPAPDTGGIIRRIACRHDSSGMRGELYAIVDQGGTVLNVIVEHPLYGELTGSLMLRSRYDVDRFIDRCSTSDALPLSFLTEGIHLHTISCPDEDALKRVLASLKKLGVLYENT